MGKGFYLDGCVSVGVGSGSDDEDGAAYVRFDVEPMLTERQTECNVEVVCRLSVPIERNRADSQRISGDDAARDNAFHDDAVREYVVPHGAVRDDVDLDDAVRNDAFHVDALRDDDDDDDCCEIVCVVLLVDDEVCHQVDYDDDGDAVKDYGVVDYVYDGEWADDFYDNVVATDKMESDRFDEILRF